MYWLFRAASIRWTLVSLVMVVDVHIMHAPMIVLAIAADAITRNAQSILVN